METMETFIPPCPEPLVARSDLAMKYYKLQGTLNGYLQLEDRIICVADGKGFDESKELSSDNEKKLFLVSKTIVMIMGTADWPDDAIKQLEIHAQEKGTDLDARDCIKFFKEEIKAYVKKFNRQTKAMMFIRDGPAAHLARPARIAEKERLLDFTISFASYIGENPLMFQLVGPKIHPINLTHGERNICCFGHGGWLLKKHFQRYYNPEMSTVEIKNLFKRSIVKASKLTSEKQMNGGRIIVREVIMNGRVKSIVKEHIDVLEAKCRETQMSSEEEREWLILSEEDIIQMKIWDSLNQ